MSTAVEDILAADKNDSGITIGDKVIYRKKTYIVDWMEHEVSGDGYYTETVYLLIRNPNTEKTVVVEDCKVELIY